MPPPDGSLSGEIATRLGAIELLSGESNLRVALIDLVHRHGYFVTTSSASSVKLVKIALGARKGQITVDFATVQDLRRILTDLGENLDGV